MTNQTVLMYMCQVNKMSCTMATISDSDLYQTKWIMMTLMRSDGYCHALFQKQSSPREVQPHGNHSYDTPPSPTLLDDNTQTFQIGYSHLSPASCTD